VERAQPGQPEEESWIESENGNEDSAGEKSGEASRLAWRWDGVGNPQWPNQIHAKARSNFLSHPKTQILTRSCVTELSTVERGDSILFEEPGLAYYQWPIAHT
jgi:hypothetical protein